MDKNEHRYADRNKGAMVGLALAGVAGFIVWLIYQAFRILRSGALGL